jgi:hypothetical protein
MANRGDLPDPEWAKPMSCRNIGESGAHEGRGIACECLAQDQGGPSGHSHQTPLPSDPAVYARLPKVHRDPSRTQGLDRLELIRFLQVSQTITVHHGALAFRWASTRCAPPKRPLSALRAMAKPCAGIGCFTWSARATSRPRCP